MSKEMQPRIFKLSNGDEIICMVHDTLNDYFKVSLPLISSDPMLSKPTFGFCLSNKTEYNSLPIFEN